MTLSTVLATGFGIGRIRGAPGTWASLAALPLGWWFAWVGDWPAVAAAGIIASVVGIWACGAHAKRVGLEDPSECVLDEIAGQFLALVPLAPTGRMLDPWAIVLAFLLFRLFDILKPWPIGRLERLSGGAGIMADDIAAGLVSAGLVALAAYLGVI